MHFAHPLLVSDPLAHRMYFDNVGVVAEVMVMMMMVHIRMIMDIAMVTTVCLNV